MERFFKLTGPSVLENLFYFISQCVATTYICSHSLAHYVVGRMVGIRFKGYGIRGSDHPYDYPPILGLRHWMQFFPTFSAITNKESMNMARPIAKALMFAAGETSTTIGSILVGWYAWSHGIPGGSMFLAAMVIFGAIVTVVTAITPRGDYAKALNALQQQFDTTSPLN